MKNRDKYILKVNEYDMLVDIQKRLLNLHCICVIEALTGKDVCKHFEEEPDEVCSKCIQKWLNEEVE